MQNYHEQLQHILNHLDHVLPGQGPIRDFVHHNTLHGYQHLPFEQALAENEALTGTRAYLPDSKNRQFYQQGRITDADLIAAFAHAPQLVAEQTVLTVADKTVSHYDVYKVALLVDLSPLSSSELVWQIEECAVLNSAESKQLWAVILNKLEISHSSAHPEDLLEVANTQNHPAASSEEELRKVIHYAQQEVDNIFAKIGKQLTLRGLVLALTGKDSLEMVRPQLIRLCAAALDEGVAAWQLPERENLGIYAGWHANLEHDAQSFWTELSDSEHVIAGLPDNAMDAIIQQLRYLDLPPEQWADYLQRLALELPGWSGQINWRQHHPNYQSIQDAKPSLADYLAIRLVLDRLYLTQLCRETWQVNATVSALLHYFLKNPEELLIRQHLYQGTLPEYIGQQTTHLIDGGSAVPHNRHAWQQLAQLFYQQYTNSHHTAENTGWRLLQLCQQLNLTAAQISELTQANLLELLAIVDAFDENEHGKIWLTAYEYHYQHQIFQGVRANHGRGRWQKREQRPQAQIIFCMDDREESIRRHLEELNPAIETLGAAGFFGIAMNYKGLDDEKVTPLCPIVVTPVHEVQEQARADEQQTLAQHQQGRQLNQSIANLVFHGLRRYLFLAQPLINALAPLTLANLLGKSFLPNSQHRLVSQFSERISPSVNTQLHFHAANSAPATPEQPRLGFTDAEQADRIAGFLRNTGLTYGFAELVVLMGHGSISQNNPHLAAYDCGACSGRHGGPNARVFAAIANRPEIRTLLAERGIVIPDDTWFIGAEHNTCNEVITWYDLGDLPPARQARFTKLQAELRHGQLMSAHERCRRLASAPRQPTPEQALAHIEARAVDFSQARPELGHATNACAVVGRRSVTQGVFFDRRIFLISYDPTQDPEGKVLEGILLAVGPVGAGINLEYYFSTVNNERLGCGSKIPHNVTGFFAVMEGASSDLRTGLPQQMIEIHEAMRLQIIVEAKTSVLEAIYSRQPALQELIGGGWVLLSAKDPDSKDIFVFERGKGFVLWQAESQELPVYEKSPDYYRGQTEPLPPVLIKHADSDHSTTAEC
jgi:hypothetical protein